MRLQGLGVGIGGLSLGFPLPFKPPPIPPRPPPPRSKPQTGVPLPPTPTVGFSDTVAGLGCYRSLTEYQHHAHPLIIPIYRKSINAPNYSCQLRRVLKATPKAMNQRPKTQNAQHTLCTAVECIKARVQVSGSGIRDQGSGFRV